MALKKRQVITHFKTRSKHSLHIWNCWYLNYTLSRKQKQFNNVIQKLGALQSIIFTWACRIDQTWWLGLLIRALQPFHFEIFDVCIGKPYFYSCNDLDISQCLYIGLHQCTEWAWPRAHVNVMTFTQFTLLACLHCKFLCYNPVHI